MASTWKVAIYLFDATDARHDTGVTKAHAVLTTSSRNNPGRLRTGTPHTTRRRRPRDRRGAAAARALRHLADRLVSATSDDIEAIEHDGVHLVHLP